MLLHAADKFHPALRRSVADLLRMQQEAELFALVLNGAPDNEVATMCRNFVSFCHKIAANDNSEIQVDDH